jgi:hypothetical protein
MWPLTLVKCPASERRRQTLDTTDFIENSGLRADLNL